MDVLDEFLDELRDGLHDEMLDVIEAGVQARRAFAPVVDQMRKLTFDNAMKGDPVRVVDTVNPKWMRGLTGTITRRNPKNAHITLDNAQTRWGKNGNRTVGKLNVPYSLLERVV